MPLVFANTVEPIDIRWLWPGRIPLGMVTLVEGFGGIGKSTWLLDIGARLSTARPMPGELIPPHRPGRAIYFLTEDSLSAVVQPRLVNAGADLSRIVLVETLTNAEGQEDIPTLPGSEPDIERAFIQAGIGAGDLVVFDPVLNHLNTKLVNYKDAQQVRHALMGLRFLAEKYGCAIVVVRHLRKGAGPAVEKGEGSMAFMNVARSVLLVAETPDEPGLYGIAVNKANLSPERRVFTYRTVPGANAAHPVVQWGDAVTMTADELTTASDPDARSRMDDAKEFVLGLLEDGPQLVKTVKQRAMAEGHSWDTVRAAKRALGIRHEKARTQDGAFVWLPPEGRKPDARPFTGRDDLGALSEPQGRSVGRAGDTPDPRPTQPTLPTVPTLPTQRIRTIYNSIREGEETPEVLEVLEVWGHSAPHTSTPPNVHPAGKLRHPAVVRTMGAGRPIRASEAGLRSCLGCGVVGHYEAHAVMLCDRCAGGALDAAD